MPIQYHASTKTWTLSGGHTSYVLHCDSEGRLMNLYWGSKIPAGAISFHPEDYAPVASFDLPASILPFELPVNGSGWYGTPAVGITNAAGDDVVDLRFVSAKVLSGKPGLPGLPATYAENAEEADSLSLLLKDELTGLSVTALFSVFADSGIITRSLKLENQGNSPLTVTSLLSASVPFWQSDLDVVHLKGAWGRERQIVRTSLSRNELVIASARGASGHEDNPFLALCEKNANEFSGSFWGCSLVYSGSFRMSCRVDNFGHARLSAGMNPEVFSWKLDPGESLVSPEAVLAFSDEGLNGLSQHYHRLYRTRLARGSWRDRSRPVLINNWEGTYFDFDEERLLGIAEKAAVLGIELFVLDDGWFGRRNSDHCSLGDWIENREKLPNGLAGLSERIHQLGLMFGLWFEPEMVSPDSDLYRAHPDWCLHVQGRTRTEARSQLVLDLSRSEVQEYLISAISDVLTSASVDYVKWDMNRNMTESFSAVLPPERKKETQHRYMLGLYRVLETITTAFPEILFESCSGGGGRFDPGMLFYMPQTWTSDNTDAVERLRLQYGTSVVYPASAMGAHVSAVPNHQTGRCVSLRMRGDVALSGNFGFELDLTKMTPEEVEMSRSLVDQAKSVRDLTRTGTFWRLLSPFEGQETAWAFVSEDQQDVLLCVFRVLSVPNSAPLRIHLRGLRSDWIYRLENGAEYHGSFLMNHGLTVSLCGDFSSRIFRFHAYD